MNNLDTMDFKRYFNSDSHSDIVVRFSDREIKAHRIVLCSNSAWFKGACEGQFKEANDSILQLNEDDPDAVEAMIRHCYGLEVIPDQAKISPLDQLQTYVSVYSTADKYLVPDLMTKMVEKFNDQATKSWALLWEEGTLLDLIERTYDMTVGSNDPLRVCIVNLMRLHCKKFQSLDENRFVQLLEAVPELSSRLVLNLLQHEDENITALKASLIPGAGHSTMFHNAARDGNVESCQAFLDLGVAVDIVDENGETPLHWAAWSGHIYATRLLVEAGAQVNARSTGYDKTPLEWARERQSDQNQYAQVIEYLTARGG